MSNNQALTMVRRDNQLQNLTLEETMNLGQILAKSGFFQDSKDAAQCVVKVLAGKELGFGPIASMTGIYIVKGRVTMSANLIAAAIQRSGKYSYRVTRMEDACCSITFFEHGQQIGVSTFDDNDAANAGLINNETWKKYRRNMLFARALTNGARWYTPEIFGGPVYTPDELGAEVDEHGEVITTPTSVHQNLQGQAQIKESDQSRRASEKVVQILQENPQSPLPSQSTEGDSKATLAARIRQLFPETHQSKEKFMEWLKSEYNADKLGDLSIEQLNKVYRKMIDDARRWREFRELANAALKEIALLKGEEYQKHELVTLSLEEIQDLYRSLNNEINELRAKQEAEEKPEFENQDAIR
jgi:hypothetical protein